jgi:hypothetical protein
MPDADGWQTVLSRGEGRQAPRALAATTTASATRRIPLEFDGRCLNCLSYNHRVATCRLPRRCIRCRSLHHLAKDCNRPRSDNAGYGQWPAGRRIARARRGGSTTTQGPASEGATPPTHLEESADDPLSDYIDGALPGHPATRPREAQCIVQRDAAIDAAEAALRFALVAQPSGNAEGRPTSEVLLAIVAATGVAPDDLRVKLFYPEKFIVVCGSQVVRDRVLGASPVPFGNSLLVLLPWTRVAHADPSSPLYKVTLEIEGVPPHVWREDTVAKMLAPACWIQSVEQAMAVSDDLSSYRLTVWAKNPSAISKVIRLGVTEPETAASSGGGGLIRQCPTVPTEEKTADIHLPRSFEVRLWLLAAAEPLEWRLIVQR